MEWWWGGKAGDNSTNKVISEGKGACSMGRFEHKPKGIFLLCRTSQGKEAGGTHPIPGSVAWSVLAATLSLVGSRRDQLGFVPRAWSQCGDTGPSLFPAQQVGRESRAEMLLAHIRDEVAESRKE